MDDVRKLTRIILVVVLVFICNKTMFRPYILSSEFPEFVNVFVLSFPNFCEAIVGSLLITNISLYIKHNYLKAYTNITEGHLYVFAVLFTATYVLLQELKIHNLGGRNVYDPYDMLFSILGVLVAYFLLTSLKPRIFMEDKKKSP